MRIIAADDEALMLDMLTDRIRQACPQGEIHPFSSARRLLAWLEETGEGFDVAFLDIEMPGMSGIALAQRLKELCPRGNLIFVTGFSQYMAEAFQLHASGYSQACHRQGGGRGTAQPALPRTGAGSTHPAGAGVRQF